MNGTNSAANARGFAARAGGWSAHHRWSAIGIWLLFVVLAVGIGSATGRVDLQGDSALSGEAGRAARIVKDAGIADPAAETVLVQARGGAGARSAEFRTAVDQITAAVAATGLVTHVTSPYDTGAIAKDGRSALVAFDVRGDSATAGDRVAPVLAAVADVRRAHPALRIEEIGSASMDKAYDDAYGSDFSRAEYSAVPVALGILLIAFGAVVAALLPVVLAITVVVATMGLMALLSHLQPMSDTADSVMLLVGLAVGVDYCLFYLRRAREERAAGRDAGTALRIAAATSGHAVVVSGVTVCVAMAGMLFTGIADIQAMGLASLMVVAVAVVGSVTVLPALLSLLGERVESGRIPFLHPDKRRSRRPAGEGSRVWRKVLDVVLAKPALSLVVAAGVLLAIAAPALGMRTQNLTVDQEFGDGMPIVAAYEHVDAAFPGGSEPARVVVRAHDITAPDVTAAIGEFRRRAVSSGASGGPVEVEMHTARNVAVLSVPLVGGADPSRAEHSLDVLRNDVRPATLGRVPGVEAPVTGQVAASKDYNDQLAGSVVPVFSFVVAFAFLLMLLSFRSLTMALTSVVLNLLSVGAAYGVLVAVFQHGWGASLVGAKGVGAVVSWLPLFLFVILFGLSTDYHVFVVSRIKEARARGLSTKDAITRGVVTTAGVVTGAAVIMVAVFAIFGTLSMQSMKQMGMGLAVAVLIDATIIRGVLLPAVMALLGEHNWYLPRWLRWLPDLGHEEPAPAAEREASPAEPEPARA